MQMATPARQPNVPQLVVDFMNIIVDAVKNPQSLEPLVQIARDVAAANKLSDEDAVKREELLKLTKESEELKAELQKTVGEINTGKAQLAEGYADIKKQKKDLAELNQALADQKIENEIAKKQVQDRELAVKRGEIDLSNRTSVIDTREAAVAKREENFKAAHSLIGAEAKG